MLWRQKTLSIAEYPALNPDCDSSIIWNWFDLQTQQIVLTIYLIQTLSLQQTTFENIVTEKGTAHNEQCLLL